MIVALTSGLFHSVFNSATPPFYQIDRDDNSISLEGPPSEKDWDTVLEVIKERKLTKLIAGGLTDRLTDSAIARLTPLDQLTHLHIAGSPALTDKGVLHLAGMPQLRDLELGGSTSPITDRGLEVLRHLSELRRFQSSWTPGITDTGLTNLAFCDRL